MQDDNAALMAEFWQAFDKGVTIVFATADGPDVTARTVDAARHGEKVYFMTDNRSVKYAQIRKNPNVALCAGATQLTGTAKTLGGIHLPENKPAMDALRAAFPDDFATFGADPGMELIAVSPVTGGFGRLASMEMYAVDFATHTVRKLEMGG